MKNFIYLIFSFSLFFLASCTDDEAKKIEDKNLQLILDQIDCEYPTFIDQNEYPYFFKKIEYENGIVMIGSLVYKVYSISPNRFALMAEEGMPFQYFEFSYIKSVLNHGLQTPAEFKIQRICKPFQPSVIMENYVITLMDYYFDNLKPKVSIRIESKSKFVFIIMDEFDNDANPEDLIFVNGNSFYQKESLVLNANERIQFYKYSTDETNLEFDLQTLTMADMFSLN